MRSLPVNQADDVPSQIQGGHEKRRVLAAFRIGRKVIENMVDGVRDVRFAGEQAEVGVETRGGRIVIPRAEMRLTANLAIGFAPRHESQFAMRFKPNHTVENLHSGFLQVARPADV